MTKTKPKKYIIANHYPSNKLEKVKQNVNKSKKTKKKTK